MGKLCSDPNPTKSPLSSSSRGGLSRIGQVAGGSLGFSIAPSVAIGFSLPGAMAYRQRAVAARGVRHSRAAAVTMQRRSAPAAQQTTEATLSYVDGYGLEGGIDGFGYASGYATGAGTGSAVSYAAAYDYGQPALYGPNGGSSAFDARVSYSPAVVTAGSGGQPGSHVTRV